MCSAICVPVTTPLLTDHHFTFNRLLPRSSWCSVVYIMGSFWDSSRGTVAWVKNRQRGDTDSSRDYLTSDDNELHGLWPMRAFTNANYQKHDSNKFLHLNMWLCLGVLSQETVGDHCAGPDAGLRSTKHPEQCGTRTTQQRHAQTRNFNFRRPDIP